MSENVTPLFPEREKRRKLRRRLLSLGCAILIVLAGVLAYLFHDELNFDRIRRYFTYLGVRGSSSYGEYTFESHSANVGRALGDGLAVASVAGLSVYDAAGELLAAVPNALKNPELTVGGDLAVGWDVGGTVLSAAGADGIVVLDIDTDGALLDVDVSDGGYICRAEAGGGYKTVLTVMDETMQETYKWYSSSQYLPLCAVSEDGGAMAAVAMGQRGGVFESSLLLFATDQEAPTATVSLGNELILELRLLSPQCVCAVGETSVRFFDDTGALLGAYEYGGSYLMDFALTGDGFAALALNQYQAGTRCSVVTIDRKGAVLAEEYLGAEILSVSAAGSYLAVLTADRLLVCTADLKHYAETEAVSGAAQAAMRRDGTALLIGSGGAHLYLP